MISALILNTESKAQNEDSCKAFMNIMPDHNDPLLMHFQFTGTVPINSFQFLGIWDFGDGFTSNDSCPDHLYAQPGTYIVCLEFSICIGGGMSCHDDTCEEITIGNIQGIFNPDGMMHQFFTYPNPVQTKFYIRSDSDRSLGLKVKDATGRTVLISSVKNDEAVDASSFASGIYLLEVSDGNAVLQRKMVVRK